MKSVATDEAVRGNGSSGNSSKKKNHLLLSFSFRIPPFLGCFSTMAFCNNSWLFCLLQFPIHLVVHPSHSPGLTSTFSNPARLAEGILYADWVKLGTWIVMSVFGLRLICLQYCLFLDSSITALQGTLSAILVLYPSCAYNFWHPTVVVDFAITISQALTSTLGLASTLQVGIWHPNVYIYLYT